MESPAQIQKVFSGARALDELPHYPVVTAKRLGELLDVSPPQAHQAIAQLTEAGILKEAVINCPFGEEAILPDIADNTE